ncbi:hypothetical protein MHK_007932, partial [Candidatus Magnetomorum sp. HK-1]
KRSSGCKNPPAIKTIKTSLSNDNSCRPHIIINVDPSDQSSNYAIESYLDNGIMPVNISHQGQWDERTNTIRWGLLSETKEISYDIYGENGTYQISGMISINGVSMPAHETLSVNVDCYLTIEQGDSILVVMDEDGVFNSPNISAIGPDPENLIWETADSPLHGTVTISGAGLSPEMNYLPNENWYGSDHFSIKVSDNNGAMDFIRVNINVNSINDPPVFKLESSEIDLNEDFSVPHFLTITMSPFGEEETIDYRLHPEEIKSAKVIIDESKERIIITSKPDANGSEMIHLIASDGRLSYTQTFQLNVTPVNDPPSFTLNTNSILLEEDFSEPHYLSIIYTYAPEDEVNQDVTYSIVQESADWADLQINPDTGRLTIRSIKDKNGFGHFTIMADDGAEQNSNYSQSITLTVSSRNDPPEFDLSKKQITLYEDFEQTEEIVIFPSAVPKDENGQIVTYRLDPEPTFVNIQLNEAEGKILITSKANQNGKQTVKIIADDGEDEYSETFQIEVHSVNDSPEFVLNTTYIERTEDFTSPVCIALTILSQPLDEKDQAITFSILPSDVSWADVHLNVNDRTGEVCFNSIKDQNGQSNFIIKADDHQSQNNIYEQSFRLTVIPENDPPLFDLSEKEVKLDEDFSFEKILTVSPRPVPSDEENQRVSYELKPDYVDFANISIHPLTGEIMITSIADKNGTQSFTIIADDRQTKAYQSLTLTIQSEPDPPEFIISQGELKLKEDFTETSIIKITPLPVPEDEQNQEVLYSLYPKAVNWADIQITYQPLQVEISAIENASGNRTFSIIASDGESDAYKDFKLIIEPVNDPPVTIIESVSEINEGSTLTLNGYQSYDIDNEVLSFLWEQVSGVPVIIDNINNSIAYVQIPKITQISDQLTFRLTVSDEDISVPEEIEIAILDVAIPGDINDDGLVDMFDLVAMLELISNIDVSEDALFESYADVNQNGCIDLGDVVYVFQQVVKSE